MTNIQKALELINTFASGDTEKAKSLLAEGYIQHNLAYGTGRDAFVGSVEYLASAPVKTTVNNIRAFEDGDKVFLQTVYNFAGAGEQVAFDIFRFDENGLIVEHWDNLAAKAAPNPSGRTQIDGTMKLKDLDKTEENRKLVENFLVDVMQNQHPEKTASYFILLPVFEAFMPLDQLIASFGEFIPFIKTKLDVVLFNAFPFNLLKGIGISIVTMLLYKRLTPILKGRQI